MDLDMPEDCRRRKKKGRGDRRKETAAAYALGKSFKAKQTPPAVTVEIHAPWLCPELDSEPLLHDSASSIMAADLVYRQSHGRGDNWDTISPHDVLVYVQPDGYRPRDSPDLIRCPLWPLLVRRQCLRLPVCLLPRTVCHGVRYIFSQQVKHYDPCFQAVSTPGNSRDKSPRSSFVKDASVPHGRSRCPEQQNFFIGISS
jgi:hypothetical protein